MAGPFGKLFAPTNQAAQESAQQQQQIRRSSTPLQTIRLNLPTTVNPRAPISRTLLEPKPNVSGADPDSAVLASIIRAMMGQNAPVPQTTGVVAPPVVPPAGSGGGRPSPALPSPQSDRERAPEPPSSAPPPPVFTPGEDRPVPPPDTGGGPPIDRDPGPSIKGFDPQASGPYPAPLPKRPAKFEEGGVTYGRLPDYKRGPY